MATVYRGRHTTLAREVAIKVLHPHLSSSQRNRKRFAREARTIEHLHHENILEIFDYSGDEADECYIVTEFLHGLTLTDWIVRVGRMPSEIAAQIGISLSRALDYAHQSGVLHRDLKPDNVMVRPDGVVKLMDFGIARFLDESQVTMTGALVGSPAYMSPEQAREGDLDGRSDLFSLGTLLFQLVTGHLPFGGSNPSVILKNIIEGNRPAVTELAGTVSPALADVIERLLQPDREQRFNRAADVTEALQACFEETGFSPELPEWQLVKFLDDPKGYEQRLNQWLNGVLLERGKAHLQSGDALSALRQFNRLLSFDEENAEVLALVQGLHTDPTPDPPQASSSRRWWALGAGALAVTAAITLGVASQQEARMTEAQAALPEEPPPEPLPLPPPEMPIAAIEPPPLKTEPAPARRLEIGPHKADPAPPKLSVIQPLAPAEDDQRPARVTFQVTGDGWAEVVCDNKHRIGKTRPPNNVVDISPGTHRCKYSSPYILDENVEFTVLPGQTHTVSVPVRARPLVIPIDKSCAETCEILRDGVSIGAVSGLGGAVEIQSPGDPHQLQARCGGKHWTLEVQGTARPLTCESP